MGVILEPWIRPGTRPTPTLCQILGSRPTSMLPLCHRKPTATAASTLTHERLFVIVKIYLADSRWRDLERGQPTT